MVARTTTSDAISVSTLEVSVPAPRTGTSPAHRASARDRIVEGTAALLARRGLQATSLTEILSASKAARGSMYHSFPRGKEQVVSEALGLAGQRTREWLDRWDGDAADVVTERFLHSWRLLLSRSDCTTGCAVLAVTVAAVDTKTLLDEAASVFRSWRTRLAQLLEHGGLPADSAAGFATLLIAASEGAVVLARAERTLEPFDLTAEQLLTQVRSLLAAARA
ncbi:helix-turn-helix domain-containing protein [Kineosporia sp. NBRC 101731]|uniref:TetR/AcrR family transcriptional regulator n=1 Tax=Kineosporia sp. NBRC 101731 TaxID=3032199 RepID=UPI0024A28E88|nr:helix-turn-helix domain-containing protein [Kineosporia sp. NBRC 101731]GLY31720.1 TetR family transcriptional regulator [Kineosporia sp. NBRC 101731]